MQRQHWTKMRTECFVHFCLLMMALEFSPFSQLTCLKSVTSVPKSLFLFHVFFFFPFSCRYIRSERSVILINFCLSIISSNALILIGQTQTRNKVRTNQNLGCPLTVTHLLDLSSLFVFLLFQVLCTLIAAFLHFFFLSSFCWVLTEAWQSYMAVTGRLRNRIIRKRFLCLGWGGPSVCCFVIYVSHMAALNSPVLIFILILLPGLPALVVAISVGFTKAKGYGTPS